LKSLHEELRRLCQWAERAAEQEREKAKGDHEKSVLMRGK
jgi:hypothetical protein